MNMRYAWIALLLLAPLPVDAQQINVSVPAGVVFDVFDVTSSTGGTPDATQVTFSEAVGFSSGSRLKISVRPDTSSFSGPGNVPIPASAVSWTATASNGTASAGTLTAAAYEEIYRSDVNPSSGTVTVRWTLAPIAVPQLRAGTHSLTIRWKFEAF